MTEEQRIQLRIADIAAVADLFPGIVIVHNLRTLGVEYMSAQGLRLFQTTLAELRALGAAYHQRYFNPDDVREYLPRLREMLTRNDSHEVLSFFQQMRPAAGHAWAWFLSTVRVLLHDEQRRPLLALTFANCLDSLPAVSTKLARLLEENDFLRQHQALFRQLTPREKHILRLLALGHTSRTIARMLTISPNTVVTHRRNIKAKLKPETSHDLALYAHAFNLV